MVHLAAIAVGGTIYISSETFLKDKLAADECRFCAPNALDRSLRDALVWSAPARAHSLSNLFGFVVTPALELSLVALASSGVDDRAARVLDDAIPVIESGVLAALLNQTVKFAVARRRPFVAFGDPSLPPDVDDNTSFYSGHTTLVFALATTAGVVAHRRGYRLAPVIWASGYILGATTGYLRIAADRHYVTDVVVGAVAGTAVGLAVPLLFHDLRGIQVLPSRDGVTIAGRF